MEVHLGLLYNQMYPISKDKRILNVFGAYDHTNNHQMWTHGYKNKTGKQFLDFIDRVDKKDGSDIKQIFLIPDNASIYRSNKVKEALSRYHPRIQLVFLQPTRSPELNLIEDNHGCIDKRSTTLPLKMKRI